MSCESSATNKLLAHLSNSSQVRVAKENLVPIQQRGGSSAKLKLDTSYAQHQHQFGDAWNSSSLVALQQPAVSEQLDIARQVSFDASEFSVHQPTLHPVTIRSNNIIPRHQTFGPAIPPPHMTMMPQPQFHPVHRPSQDHHTEDVLASAIEHHFPSSSTDTLDSTPAPLDSKLLFEPSKDGGEAGFEDGVRDAAQSLLATINSYSQARIEETTALTETTSSLSLDESHGSKPIHADVTVKKSEEEELEVGLQGMQFTKFIQRLAEGTLTINDNGVLSEPTASFETSTQ